MIGRTAAAWGGALIVLLAVSAAHAQQVQVRLESRELYAGVPFTLAVSATGFEETPEPTVSDIEIPGCTVTYLGMSPNVSTSITVINGRRSGSRTVELTYRYRVVAAAAGTYEVPTVTVQQGAAKASSRGGSISVTEVAQTRDMQIRLVLPDRPVWVGETIEARLEWDLRADVSDHQLIVPLLEMPEQFEVTAPEPTSREVLSLPAGGGSLEVPYVRSTVKIGGAQYTRFTLPLLVTPLRSGLVELEPPRAVARLQVGWGRDSFGFRQPKRTLFKAEGEPTSLEVRSPPAQGKPASFVNATGSSFALAVTASRTVVRVGEPIELQVEVRGDGRLDGLSLPAPEAMGLSERRFAVVDASGAGELSEDRKSKNFVLTVRLDSAEAREIPPLELGYFDPAAGEYRVARSQPVALSVAGSAVVGAQSVVRADNTEASSSGTGPSVATLVGADLALSAADETFEPTLAPHQVRWATALLYLVPLLVAGGLAVRRRGGSRRAEDRAIRTAKRALEQAVRAAGSQPKREAAPVVAAALRRIGQATQAALEEAEPLLQRLETEAYDPRAANDPLDSALLAEVRELAERWASGARKAPVPKARLHTAALLAVVAAFVPIVDTAYAAEPDDKAMVAEARTVYEQALAASDAEARVRGFVRAEELFRDVSERYGDRPQLLTDWGNAALGARKRGVAVLAYRRALALDPTAQRARRNLQWVRASFPDAFAASDDAAASSLFFWRSGVTPAQQQLLAGLVFALAVALACFGGWPRRAAILPAVVWCALIAAVITEPDYTEDAVLVAGATLRAADNTGAPPVHPEPLPAGVELTLHEQRGQWVRVGWGRSSGWAPRSAVEPVVPR